MAAPHLEAEILSAATLCCVRILVDREAFHFSLDAIRPAEDFLSRAGP